MQRQHCSFGCSADSPSWCIADERLPRFSELPLNMSAWIIVVSGYGTLHGPIKWRSLANLAVIKHGLDVAWQRVICAPFSQLCCRSIGRPVTCEPASASMNVNISGGTWTVNNGDDAGVISPSSWTAAQSVEAPRSLPQHDTLVMNKKLG